MSKTGAQLVCYALEQLGIEHTFATVGTKNAVIYDQLSQSKTVSTHIVKHDMSAAFMADAVSRAHPDQVGTMLIASDTGVTQAISGIAQALLAGSPLLIIAGAPALDLEAAIDQQAVLAPLTKAAFKINEHQRLIETLFEAYNRAISAPQGPVFVEISLDLQRTVSAIKEPLPRYGAPIYEDLTTKNISLIGAAIEQLLKAKNPGIFVGWGAVDAQAELIALAEAIAAPVTTTMQGLSSFPNQHPLHAGMIFGPGALPSAQNAFADCDCVLAIGTSFNDMSIASDSVIWPEKLIHIDHDAVTVNTEFPNNIALCGDVKALITALLLQLQEQQQNARLNSSLINRIASDKAALKDDWYAHNSRGQVNPAVFFDYLSEALDDDAILVAEAGQDSFLAAELMAINSPRGFISATNLNTLGYCVPAVNAAKLVNPNRQVVGIVGEAAMTVTGMEALLAVREKLGTVYCIFNDGSYSAAKNHPMATGNSRNRNYGDVNWGAFADAIDCAYIRIEHNNEIETALRRTLETAAQGQPIFVDVHIDYSRTSHYGEETPRANVSGLSKRDKMASLSRGIMRKFSG